MRRVRFSSGAQWRSGCGYLDHGGLINPRLRVQLPSPQQCPSIGSWRNPAAAHASGACARKSVGVRLPPSRQSIPREWCNGSHASSRGWCPQGRPGSSPGFRTGRGGAGSTTRFGRQTGRQCPAAIRGSDLTVGLAPEKPSGSTTAGGTMAGDARGVRPASVHHARLAQRQTRPAQTRNLRGSSPRAGTALYPVRRGVTWTRGPRPSATRSVSWRGLRQAPEDGDVQPPPKAWGEPLLPVR